MAMAAFQLHNRPPPSAVPCRQSTVLLLLCLLLSCSHPISCTCSGYQQDPLGNLSVSGAFDQLPGHLFLTNMSTCRTHWERVDCRGLGAYMKTNYPSFDLSQKGWFFIRQHIVLVRHMYNDRTHEASFSVAFTMSIYQPNNQTKEAHGSLVFAIEPLFLPHPTYLWDTFTTPNGQVLGPSSSSNPMSSANSGGVRLSAEIGTARDNGTLLYAGDIIWVQIGIDPPGNSSVTTASKYSVWIDYDHAIHRMSVYIDAGEDAPKPANAIASKKVTIRVQYALLGLFASMGQLLQVHTWNSTSTLPHLDDKELVYGDGQQPPVVLSNTVAIVILVVATVVVTAIPTAALVLWYLKSKYRRWKKEQDELTKIMQGIPGVPAHVDFTEIRKATKNFHETMKLGKGGFGAVYRCKLPPAVRRKNIVTPREAMDVAVKKFTREVEDHRCSDFIAEVSIINRLRHKNIVPLIGWSYHKGEALLIYEYMTNGSLDQHLFQKASTQQQQQEDGDMSSLRQWHTRYGIARDIATGLHYVHHEHEPMVLHRDIKASNIMLDSDFRARLGDFGIACAVARNRSSVTGIAGTWGYIAPDYAMCYKATRQTDIYAFGVLILEIVTGKKNGDMVDIPPDDDEHITDWIWRLHEVGKLLDAVDDSVLGVAAGCGGDRQDDGVADEARRLLLLGLACTDPNPLDRPSMAQVLQVIAKVMPPPDVPPEKPAFVWPPRDWRSRNSVYSTAWSDWDRDLDGSLATTADMATVSMGQRSTSVARGHASVRSRSTQTLLGRGGDYTEAQSRRSP